MVAFSRLLPASSFCVIDGLTDATFEFVPCLVETGGGQKHITAQNLGDAASFLIFIVSIRGNVRDTPFRLFGIRRGFERGQPSSGLGFVFCPQSYS